MKYAYPAILSPEADGCFSIWFPDLPGCATSGESIPDALENARDALGLWLDSQQRHGHSLPSASPLQGIAPEGGQTASWIDIDLDAYRSSLGEKAVKKTLTIPQWMDTMVTEDGGNFSQLLQDAICQRYGIENP